MKTFYISRLLIALCLFVGTIGVVHSTSAAATGFSDQFNSSSLASGWTWIDPLGDSSYSLTANPGHLRLYTPDSGHDLYLNLDAPRMMQTVTGDFTISTKVTIDPQFNYQGAGLLLWQDANNYIRLERTLVSGIDVWHRLNGGFDGTEIPYSASPTVYLRFERTGHQIFTSYSEDNVNWIYVANFGGFLTSESLQVGLVLINEWQDNPIWADFDYFEVEGSPPSSNTVDYFALGDSIASGHGLMDDKSACRRSERSYPYKVAELLRTRYETVNFPTSTTEDGTEVQHFLACSGATALPPATGFTGDPNKMLPNQVGYVLAHLSDRPTLVSITIGANDFGWTDLPNLFARLYLDSDEKFKKWVDNRIKQIKKPLKAMVELLLEEENVAIVLTDFHNPFNTESLIFRAGPKNTCATRDCYARTQYVAQEITDMIIDIRTELGNPERLQILSIRPEFQGHEAPSPNCGFAEPNIENTYIQYLYDIHSNSDPELPGWLTKRLGEVRGGDCVHPNEAGAAIYAQYVNDDAIRLGR